jgi:SAM-dependent MidA family methyltransferase
VIALDLPPLSESEAQHEARVIARIGPEVAAAGGWLSFERFMDLALYAPGLGYYATGIHPIGAGGDYTTAPELSPVFGRCLATSLAAVLSAVADGEVLEVGAGSGILAAQILAELARQGRRPRRYRILEVSAALRALQAATLAREVPHEAGLVTWLDRLPDSSWQGAIVANEVADALPVTRFGVTTDSVEEHGVAWTGERFAWCPRPADKSVLGEVRTIEAELGHGFESGYVSEYAPRAGPWLSALLDSLSRGVIYLLDYGLPRAEYYANARAGGTLACFYRQRVHGDPFRNVGVQDISAWVDFTRLATAGVDAGLELAGFTTQAHFLLDCGFDRHLSAVTAGADSAARYSSVQRASTLVLPGEMGEKFKCLALSRAVDPPPGFAGVDLATRL